jgi:asparagine synthase (glutamine-hydrolysing)
MCGICGVFYPQEDQLVSPDLLSEMTSTLLHRGPDDGGVWSAGSVGFGHRRLTILDLNGGRQPMVSEESGTVLVFNGEIYNFQSLRRELESKGHRFRNQGDTEVILRAYEAFGERCVVLLRGMFAFVLWDPARRRIFAARDRLGIKPLYYYYDGKTFAFASELKALMRLRVVQPELDYVSIREYLLRQFVPGPRTVYRRIRQLRPARYLTCDRRGVSEVVYWSLEAFADSSCPDRDLVPEVRNRLDEAVSSHLVSDVPIGAFLSGGIDSSLVVALMQRHRSSPIKTFSVGFDGAPGYSELDFAQRAARWIGTDHHALLLGPRDVSAHLSEVVGQMDQPLGDYAALPTYLVSRLAASQVKVVLTGEGADELFGGYRRYLTAWIRARFAGIPRVGPVTWNGARYQATHMFSETDLSGLLGTRLPRAQDPDDSAEAVSISSDSSPPRAKDWLDQFMRTDLKTWLPDDLLAKVDRMSMLASLEARVPYLDHELVAFVMGIPGFRKIDVWRLRLKSLLKAVARDLLPSDIIRRKKHGFTLPVEEWLRQPLREVVHDLLVESSAGRKMPWDSGFVARLVREHQAGKRHGHKIWGLLVLEMWCRQSGRG